MLQMLSRAVRRVMLAEKPRSLHWPTVRKHHLEQFPTCAVCGGSKKLEVHHKLPFHIDSKEELNPKNLITLCEKSEVIGGTNCHFVFGHAGNWHDYVPKVEENAALLLPQIKSARGK